MASPLVLGLHAPMHRQVCISPRYCSLLKVMHDTEAPCEDSSAGYEARARLLINMRDGEILRLCWNRLCSNLRGLWLDGPAALRSRYNQTILIGC